jgi:rod shape determining protein RodA
VGRYSSFDWVLFALALALSLSGLVYIYSATWIAHDPPGVWFSPLAIKQLIFLVLALAVFFLLQRLNWSTKPTAWLWVYFPVVALLLAVLVIGAVRGGSRRWLNLGVVDLQPSEFAKLGLILMLAWLFSAEAVVVRRRFVTALAITGSLLALVMLQPDLGTSMVFVAIFFVMCLFSTLPRRLLLFTALALVLLALPAWFVMHDYQKARITSFINPAADPQGTGYHLTQSRIAVGSGGLTGKGFLRGTQARGGFIPVIESDFIFALVAEEFGFVGCFYLLGLYFLLLVRILALSREAKTAYERFICYGASAMILFHVFIAAGMTIGITPITGLPLPFVAYGGSALLTMWVLVAMLQSIYASSRREFHSHRYRR